MNAVDALFGEREAARRRPGALLRAGETVVPAEIRVTKSQIASRLKQASA
jgi:hypothetical protein